MRRLVYVGLAVAVLVLHFANLEHIVYRGEDEPEVRQQALLLLDFQKAALTHAWHAPERYAISAAGIALFGDNTFGLRFFHALSGLAIFGALYVLARSLGESARLTILLLYTAVAPVALHRVAHGHGVFIALALWAFVLFEMRRGWATIGGLFLVAAAFLNSFEGIVFYPLAALYWWNSRRTLPLPAWLASAAVTVAPVLLIFWLWAIRWQVLGVGQLIGRSQGAQPLGVFHLGDKVSLYWSALTPVFVLLLVLGTVYVVWKRVRPPRTVWMLGLWFLPHTLVWILVLYRPASHPLWDYPVWVVFTGWCWSLLWGKVHWARPAYLAAVLVAGFLTFDTFTRLIEPEQRIATYYGARSIPSAPPPLGPRQ